MSTLIPSDDAQPVPAIDPLLNVSPFEGPEKLLEVWFAPSVDVVRRDDDPVDSRGARRSGLRRVKREEWEEMLAIVKCQVLSVVEGREMDAYLLSESSLFVSPHRLILKTCGTTLNLLGLPRILAIAASEPCGLPHVHRLFYSRKSFMFPERQQGPHREWKEEVAFLDDMFGKAGKQQKGSGRAPGSAYTVGSVNRDHWLLYMTGPDDDFDEEGEGDDLSDGPSEDIHQQHLPAKVPIDAPLAPPDFTIEILMSKLSASARRPFLFTSTTDGMAMSTPDSACHVPQSDIKEEAEAADPAAATPHHARGLALSHELGITDLFPASRTTLDAFAFEPCGYSANALIRTRDEATVGHAGEEEEGYYTIHVTPEEGWSYASFECNISLPPSADTPEPARGQMPDLHTLIQRVVKIFQPGHITLTLFVSTSTSPSASANCPIDAAQATFHRALTTPGTGGWEYRRTDKINYEFGGYDLAFASFERKGRTR